MLGSQQGSSLDGLGGAWIDPLVSLPWSTESDERGFRAAETGKGYRLAKPVYAEKLAARGRAGERAGRRAGGQARASQVPVALLRGGLQVGKGPHAAPDWWACQYTVSWIEAVACGALKRSLLPPPPLVNGTLAWAPRLPQPHVHSPPNRCLRPPQLSRLCCLPQCSVQQWRAVGCFTLQPSCSA